MKRTLLCVLMLAVSAVPVPTGAVLGDRWRTHQKTGEIGLHLIEPVGEADTWFFGDRGAWGEPPVALHWDGRGIEEVALPGGIRGTVYDADFASADDGWAVGMGHDSEVFVLRWDGDAWRLAKRAPAESGVLGVKALGRGAVLVTGVLRGEFRREDTEVNWEFDGRSWTEEEADFGLDALSGEYALRRTSTGQALVRWDGGRWTDVPVDALPEPAENPLEGDGEVELGLLESGPSGEVWLTAEQYSAEETAVTHLLHWDGERWRRERVPLPSAHSSADLIASDGRGGLWVAAGSTGLLYDSEGSFGYEDNSGAPLLYHRLPSGGWKSVRTDADFADMALVPGTDALWAVGDHGFWDESAVFARGRAR